MFEQIFIFLIFFVAVAYLGNTVRKSFSAKSGSCAKGCGGGCSTIDFGKIEAEMKKKELEMAGK
jgi:hypothetical protein